MLEKYGTVPLEFPGHYYEVEGGIVIIYWEAERSVGCIGTILYVEVKNSFTFRVYGWQGKSRQTQDRVVSSEKVWRLVHRAEFEQVIRPTDIRVGETIRICTRSLSLEKTGFVKKVDNKNIGLEIFTGLHKGKDITLELDNIKEVTEICSCPLFHL